MHQHLLLPFWAIWIKTEEISAKDVVLILHTLELQLGDRATASDFESCLPSISGHNTGSILNGLNRSSCSTRDQVASILRQTRCFFIYHIWVLLRLQQYLLEKIVIGNNQLVED